MKETQSAEILSVECDCIDVQNVNVRLFAKRNVQTPPTDLPALQVNSPGLELNAACISVYSICASVYDTRPN